jgi:hypothetical protein
MKPRRLPGLRPHRLYSAATADAVYRDGRRGQIWTVAGIAPLFSGLVLVAHVEMPLLAQLAGACEGARYLALCAYSPLYDGLAALLGLLFYGAFVMLLFHFIRHASPPTVYCRRCDGAGWVRDLEPTAGRCPLCHHDLFAYCRHAVPTGRGLNLSKLLEPEVPGIMLIARRKAQGWWSRLWWPIH